MFVRFSVLDPRMADLPELPDFDNEALIAAFVAAKPPQRIVNKGTGDKSGIRRTCVPAAGDSSGIRRKKVKMRANREALVADEFEGEADYDEVGEGGDGGEDENGLGDGHEMVADAVDMGDTEDVVEVVNGDGSVNLGSAREIIAGVVEEFVEEDAMAVITEDVSAMKVVGVEDKPESDGDFNNEDRVVVLTGVERKKKRKRVKENSIPFLKRVKSSSGAPESSQSRRLREKRASGVGLRHQLKRSKGKSIEIVAYSDSESEWVVNRKGKKKLGVGYLFKRSPNRFMERLMTRDDCSKLDTYSWSRQLRRLQRAAAQVLVMFGVFSFISVDLFG